MNQHILIFNNLFYLFILNIKTHDIPLKHEFKANVLKSIFRNICSFII